MLSRRGGVTRKVLEFEKYVFEIWKFQNQPSALRTPKQWIRAFLAPLPRSGFGRSLAHPASRGERGFARVAGAGRESGRSEVKSVEVTLFSQENGVRSRKMRYGPLIQLPELSILASGANLRVKEADLSDFGVFLKLF